MRAWIYFGQPLGLNNLSHPRSNECLSILHFQKTKEYAVSAIIILDTHLSTNIFCTRNWTEKWIRERTPRSRSQIYKRSHLSPIRSVFECTCTACPPWCPGLRVAPTHPPAWQWHLWDGLWSFYKHWRQGRSLQRETGGGGGPTDCLNITVFIRTLFLWEKNLQMQGFQEDYR